MLLSISLDGSLITEAKQGKMHRHYQIGKLLSLPLSRKWCLQRLNDQNQLPEFEQNRLTKAKVRDRTYEFIKSKSKFHFKIVRHMNAWKDLSRYEEIIQAWDFDFEKLALTKLH